MQNLILSAIGARFHDEMTVNIKMNPTIPAFNIRKTQELAILKLETLKKASSYQKSPEKSLFTLNIPRK